VTVFVGVAKRACDEPTIVAEHLIVAGSVFGVRGRDEVVTKLLPTTRQVRPTQADVSPKTRPSSMSNKYTKMHRYSIA
jgi:hypothetical protein